MNYCTDKRVPKIYEAKVNAVLMYNYALKEIPCASFKLASLPIGKKSTVLNRCISYFTEKALSGSFFLRKIHY